MTGCSYSYHSIKLIHFSALKEMFWVIKWCFEWWLGPVHTMPVWLENGTTDLVSSWFCYGLTSVHTNYVHTMPLWFENAPKSLRKGLLFTWCRHENHLKTVRNENGTLVGMKWKQYSIRHRVNTCQSATESWRHQVSGAVFKSYQHRVNGASGFVSCFESLIHQASGIKHCHKLCIQRQMVVRSKHVS